MASAAVDASSLAGSYIVEDTIFVRDPKKQGSNIKQYITYKVASQDAEVVRRYSDFLWLYQTLEREFAGVIIPPLPEKQISGRFEASFIETRRRYLQKFLNRVVQHPVLRSADALKEFLHATDDELSQAKARFGATNKGMLQWLSETMRSVQQSFSGTEQPKTDEDLAFDELCNYVDSLEPHTQKVAKHAVNVVKQQQELRDAMREFGLAFDLLGQSESNLLGSALSHLGQATDRLSKLCHEHALQEDQHFAQPLQDYVRMIGAVKAALVKRTQHQSALHLAKHDQTKAQAHLQKLQQSNAKPSRIDSATADARKADAKVEKCTEQLNVVQSRLQDEIMRFREDKVEDFKQMMLRHVELQVNYHQQVEKVWEGILPELEELERQVQSSDVQPSSATAGASDSASATVT